jgi:gamma-glutamyltranspeptidase/glutathione hydrolase
MYLPGLDLAPESRVKKEHARRLWRMMNEPAWQNFLSLYKPKSAGANHSAGVVAVDAQGNVAAIGHSLNGGIWGTHGIFVDGISIPDSASFQQTEIAKLKPGSRLPDPANPVIALNEGKPYLASSTIGTSMHQTNLNNLVDVLDFGMDLKKSIDTPNFKGPFLGLVIGGGPPAPQDYKEALAEGDFDEKLVESVIAKGQAIKLLSKPEAWHQGGLWVAILIDPKTGMRVGAAPTGANGAPAGY